MQLSELLSNFSNAFRVNVAYDFMWFVVSTTALSVVLPAVIEYRQHRKQRPIRRMIASRLARVQQTLAAYLTAVSENPDKTLEQRKDQLADVKNAIHHLMQIPMHFTVALGGDIGSRYFEYRIVATNVAATAAIAANDYDDFFRSIFFTKAVIPPSSISELNDAYARALDVLGADIHRVRAMQKVVPVWSSHEVGALEESYAKLRAAMQ